MTTARRLTVLAAVAFGAWARFVYPLDIEYKEDEEYLFFQSIEGGITGPWPWLGIPSTVYVKNPGASVWFFMVLGRLFQAWDPVSLSQAVQAVNVFAILLAVAYCIRRVTQTAEKEIWEWGIAIASVNPIAIIYQRKIWAQSVMPFLAIMHLWAWSTRASPFGSFCWGLLAIGIGQIHMSGFFIGFGFIAWTALSPRARRNTRWRPFFLGASLATLPLLPWLHHFFFEPTGKPLFYGWDQIPQLRYFVFWFTSPMGFHLGNFLGVRFGDESLYHQLRDFLAWPRIATIPTYGVAILHFGLFTSGIVTLIRGWRAVLGWKSEAQGITFWIVGSAMTVSTIVVRRFYLLTCFPLDSIALARAAVWNCPTADSRPLSIFRHRRLILSWIILQSLSTAAVLHYLHANQG